MPCLLALLALISPRLALFFVFLFSDMLDRAFDGWLLPLLGFFLLPWTTLAYTVMWDTGTRTVDGFEWFIVVLAFLADLASYAGGRSYRYARACAPGRAAPRHPRAGRPAGADPGAAGGPGAARPRGGDPPAEPLAQGQLRATAREGEA